jgi:hypothetical protein
VIAREERSLERKFRGCVSGVQGAGAVVGAIGLSGLSVEV